MKKLSAGRFAASIWLPATGLIVWWVAADDESSLYFPPPARILEAVREIWFFDHFRSDLIPSLQVLFSGFALGVILAIAVGLLVGSSPKLFGALQPEIEFGRSLPGVAVLPIAIVLFGIEDQMRIAVVALGCFWPVLINTIYGVRGLDPTIRDVERTFQLSPTSRFFRVRLPAVMPDILAGTRVALLISVSVLAVAEMIGAGEGIGNFVLTAQRHWAVVDMWSGMVVLGVLGYALSMTHRGAERVLLRNYPSDISSR